jgi:hypothetical protein
MRARLFAAAIGLLAAVLPATASASGGMTVATATTIPLTNRVLVSVPVSVVCTDIAGLTPFFDQIKVDVSQANGRSVSHGSGGITASSGFTTTFTPLFTCDGTTVNSFVVPVVADTGGTPFHGGPAVVTVSTLREEGVSCGVSCFTNIQDLTGSTGTVPVKLH